MNLLVNLHVYSSAILCLTVDCVFETEGECAECAVTNLGKYMDGELCRGKYHWPDVIPIVQSKKFKHKFIPLILSVSKIANLIPEEEFWQPVLVLYT